MAVRRNWRARAGGALLAVVMTMAGILVGPRPASADVALDTAMCLSNTTGSISVSEPTVVWGDTVGVTWHANMSSYCTAGTGAALHVYVNDIDQGPAGGVGPNGSLTVVPFQTTSVMLVLFSGGSKTLGSASVSVTAYDPPPLERGTKITLLDNDPVWRRLFVRAVRTQDAVVTIAGGANIDLSGLESVPVASGVQIIGDRSVVPVGPRLYTRTFPHTLLQIGNDDSHNPGTSDGVRISGIRLDGGMGDDPWSAVGKDDADGIGVFSSQHVEIDHNELYGWRGSAVNVHDGQNLVNQDNASTVWIHDNYIHHNQHPSADTCVDSLIGRGHAAGYGVQLSYGGYALIERNVFDYNRHSIAGDGSDGTGYYAYRNLILTHGGVHFRCVPNTTWMFVLNPFVYTVEVSLGILDVDFVYHTHAIDMHGSNDSGSGDHMSGPAGEYMDVEYNTVLYTAGNGIHLRGTPTLGTGSPPGTKVGMEVKHNVFAHSDQWAGIFNGVLSPGAMLQNATGLTASENTYGLNTFGDRRSCDFDGDGTPDSLIATGITWWYASSQLGGRWVYFDTSTTRVADLTLRDVDGDGRCDITDHGVVHLSNGTGILSSYNPYGSPIAAARDGGGRLTLFGTTNTDSVLYRAQATPGASLPAWSQFDGALRSVAAETNADGRVELFGVNGSGQIFSRLQTSPGNWTGSSWQSFDGLLKSIAAARNSDGRLEMFGTNTAGQVWHRIQSSPGNWAGSTWQPFDGLLSQVAAETNNDGRVELFGVNTAGQVWHRVQTGAGNWSGSAWQQFDGSRSSITAARNSDGRLEMFAANSNGDTFHRIQASPGNWTGSAWQSYGGPTRISQVAAETNDDGRVDLFAVDPSGQVYHRVQPTRGDWTNSNWGLLDGSLRSTVPIVPGVPLLVSNNGNQASGAGTQVSLTHSVSGGTAPVTWSASGLPPGLAINPSTGLVTGVPTTLGTFGVTVTVTDSSNPMLTASTTYAWTIAILVPDVHNQLQATAEQTLQAKGLGTQPHNVTVYDSSDKGKVMSQSPIAGSLVPAGTTVQLGIGLWSGSNR